MMGEALAQTLTGKPTQYKPDIGSIQIFRHRIPNLRMGFAKQLEHEIQFYWEYKDGKKAFESRSIKKVDSFRITLEYACVMSFLTKYLLRKNSRLCHPAFGRSQFRSRVIY
jgi:hypothetical protein